MTAEALRKLVQNGMCADQDPDAVLGPLHLIRKGSRSTVWRSRVESADEPYSLVIKQMRNEFDRGFSDLAGLKFLGGVILAGLPCPSLAFEDAEHRVFAMYEFGDTRTLSEVLAEDDAGAATSALGFMGMKVGQYSAATKRKRPEYETIRAEYPGTGCDRRAEAAIWLEAQDKTRTWLEALALQPAPGYARAVNYVAATYRNPTGFLAFSQGDPAPSNVLVNESGHTEIIDFEYCGYRHAMYDITAWEILCPLPYAALERVRYYFHAVILGRGMTRGEENFNEGWATMCAFRGLAILSWISPAVLKRDRRRAENWSAREAVLVAVLRTARATNGFPKLQSISDTLSALEDKLRERWPNVPDTGPRFAALRAEP